MEAWQQFIIALSPIIVALISMIGMLIKLNGRVKQLELEKASCMKMIDEQKASCTKRIDGLEARLMSLTVDHSALQVEYKANLKAQAGMRDKF